MKTSLFSQCTLKKKNSERSTTQIVSWIPIEFAMKGKFLKLKNEAGDWENGWCVETVGFTKLDEKHLPDWRKGIWKHRNSTGDNLPKLES